MTSELSTETTRVIVSLTAILPDTLPEISSLQEIVRCGSNGLYEDAGGSTVRNLRRSYGVLPALISIVASSPLESHRITKFALLLPLLISNWSGINAVEHDTI